MRTGRELGWPDSQKPGSSKVAIENVNLIQQYGDDPTTGDPSNFVKA